MINREDVPIVVRCKGKGFAVCRMGDGFFEFVFIIETFQVYQAVETREGKFPATFVQYDAERFVLVGCCQGYVVFDAVVTQLVHIAHCIVFGADAGFAFCGNQHVFDSGETYVLISI